MGGSVRDELLGLPVKDHDYVVVGSTPEAMEQLGYRPVGKDFPVFLHPETKEEYALARTERKITRGYKGFEIFTTPQVTLQEDLIRRDLTINAIAKDASGNIIDPFNGVADLKAGILRHISPAFSEDPVRILRTARFAARFSFRIAPETLVLMKDMVHNGEVEALVPERVWQEISRGLMTSYPSRMFEILRDCGALARVFPEIDALFGVPQPSHSHPEIDTGLHTMQAINYAASQHYVLPVRFATLLHDIGKSTTPPQEWPNHIDHEQRGVQLVVNLCERIRVPKHARDLAVLVTQHHCQIHRAEELPPSTIVDLLQAVDAYRKPDRFIAFLQACASDFHSRPGYADKPYPPAARLSQALSAIQSINAGEIAAKLQKEITDSTLLPAAINAKIREARIAKIKQVQYSQID